MTTNGVRQQPLSVGQRALWFLNKLNPDETAYTLSRTIRVNAEAFDPATVRSQMQQLIDRHAILRTRYGLRDGEPVQLIDAHQIADFTVTDGGSYDTDDITRWARTESDTPFDLEHGPVIRVRALHCGASYVVVFSGHHIALDMWSLAMIGREIFPAATGCASQANAGSSYADFAHWQAEWMDTDAGRDAWAYWSHELRGELPVLRLPQDRARPAAALSYRGAQYEFTVDATVTAALRLLAREERATLYVLLLAAYQAVLHRHSGQEDILVVSPVTGRSERQFRTSIGYFVNLVMLRAGFGDAPSFLDHVRRTRRSVADARKHQEFPFPTVVERLAPPRRSGEDPFLRAAFAFQRMVGFDTEAMAPFVVGSASKPDRPLTLGDATISALAEGLTPVQADLTLMIVESGNELLCSLQYNADIYDEATVARLGSSMTAFLAGAVRAPQTAVDELPVLGDEDRRLILTQFNDTGVTESDCCIHELVQRQVDRTPDAVALRFGGRSLTYRELDERANAVAWNLLAAGAGPGRRVAVCLDRSVEMVVGLLAVLKSGAAYVPMDPETPIERLASMVTDAQPCAVLTCSPRTELFTTLLRNGAPGAATVALDTCSLPARSTERPTVGTAPTDPAYVIYTSGSTGTPKGTVNVHAGVVNHLRWRQRMFGLTSQDRVLQKTPYIFDVSVWEIFLPLTTGARLVVAPPGGHADPAYLKTALHQERISVVHFVPSMLDIFLDEPELRCADLRLVMCGGESLTEGLRRRFFDRFDMPLHLCYGPTETCIATTYLRCESSDVASGVRIGRPIDNTTAYILDAHDQPVPIGVVGEIHVGGRSVGGGYLNNPALTAQRFVADPFSADTGALMYRTGDFGKYLPDGCIEFCGRRDKQVKLRGLRIELGDIESALRRHSGVRDAIVRLDERTDNRQLVAYVVTEPSGPATESDLRTHTRRLLPRYMVPAAWVLLDRFPLGPTGKVDVQRLPAPDPVARGTESHEAPGTPLEADIAAVWADLLDLPAVGRLDNFFDLGGHSLLAARMAAALETKLGQRLPLAAVISNPTVAGIAAALSGGAYDDDTPGDLLSIGALPLRAKTDAVLGDDVVRVRRRDADPPAPRRVLLTGATGFVGAHLLAELLDSGVEQVVCLVRAGGPVDVAERVRRALLAQHLPVSGLDRATVLEADLSRPLLGLDPRLFGELAADCDTIYHNAAEVSLVRDYEGLRGANVVATREILRLAAAGRPSAVHYVSTLSVAPPALLMPTIPEDFLGPHPALWNGYAQTKWVAEQLVRQAAERGLRASVYRLGRVLGVTSTGVVNDHDPLLRTVLAGIRAGVLPDLDATEIWTPVEFVARAIVTLARQPHLGSAVFNLAPNTPVSLNGVADWVRDFGYPVAQHPIGQWRADLAAGGVEDPALDVLHSAVRDTEVNLDVLSVGRVAHANVTAGLAGSAVVCPEVDRSVLHSYLRHCVDAGLLPEPEALSALAHRP